MVRAWRRRQAALPCWGDAFSLRQRASKPPGTISNFSASSSSRHRCLIGKSTRNLNAKMSSSTLTASSCTSTDADFLISPRRLAAVTRVVMSQLIGGRVNCDDAGKSPGSTLPKILTMDFDALPTICVFGENHFVSADRSWKTGKVWHLEVKG